MKTRKDLKPGDACIILYTPHGKSTIVKDAVALSVGRKWISVSGYRRERFAIDTGRQDTEYTAYMHLYGSTEEMQAERGDRDRREELRMIIASRDLHLGLGRLTTEAAERIAAILQDPASQRPA